MEKIAVRRHIFEFIVDYHERWHYQPFRSEIRKVFSGLSDDVDLHLEQLAREGLLTLDADSGQVSLTPPCSATKLIRLSGVSGTGVPEMLAIDLQALGVDTTSDLLGRVIVDDSMIDAGLQKQDIAIYRVGAPAPGEIVLAEMSGKLVFRRYLVIRDIPHLLSENLRLPDLSAAFGVHIHGVLCCVISPRSKPATSSAPQAVRKVNYVREANPIPKLTRWPAAPSEIGLNDRGGPSYTASRRHHTSEDPPEQAYGHVRSDAAAELAIRRQKDAMATGTKKVNSKRVRASDASPIRNLSPETSKGKRTLRIRTSPRV